MAELEAWLGVAAGNLPGDFARHHFSFGKEFNDDKYGTGSLVTREGTAALERRRRRLYELVRSNGPGRRRAGKRAAFGADPLPQKLDPGTLRRARSHLLAGRVARSAPDRSDRSYGDEMRGSRQGSFRPAG